MRNFRNSKLQEIKQLYTVSQDRVKYVTTSNTSVSEHTKSSIKLTSKLRKKRKLEKPLSRKEFLSTLRIFRKRLDVGKKEVNKSSEADRCIVVNVIDNVPLVKMREDINNKTRHKLGKFKKFHDNSKRRLKLRKTRRAGNSTSSNQVLANNLLRSIKKRQKQNTSKHNKLFFANKINMPEKTLNLTTGKATKHNTSIEEGEIISDDEVNTSRMSVVVDNDDDCICIEPHIEKIVIDDDTPSQSKIQRNTSSGYVSIIKSFNKHVRAKLRRQLITSTPISARSNDGETTAQNNDEGLSSLFYEDVSGINSLEKTTSDGTVIKYTTLPTLVGTSKKKMKKKKLKVKEGKKNEEKLLTLEEIISLDDFTDDSTLKPVKKKEKTKKDDSVIFICETTLKSNKTASDFVPLNSVDVPNPIIVPKSPPRTPRAAAIRSGLFTTSEKKELVAYNDNAYNPNAGDPKAPEKQTKKRLILIDGCNVAFHHALSREFSVKGLKICIDYFEKMGHEVKAVVPQFRMHKCSDSAAMFELHKTGKLVPTPCKNLPGKFAASYDDRFILQLAAEMDAVIVSNDNFRDLINENTAFKKLIENRVIGFTWCNDLFMVAKDPYGKWGPPLQVILNRI